MEDVVHLHCLGQLKLIGLATNFVHDLEWTNVSRQEFLCQVAFLDVQIFGTQKFWYSVKLKDKYGSFRPGEDCKAVSTSFGTQKLVLGTGRLFGDAHAAISYPHAAGGSRPDHVLLDVDLPGSRSASVQGRCQPS